MRTVVRGCAVATVDAAGNEYAEGHLVVEGNRTAAVGRVDGLVHAGIDDPVEALVLGSRPPLRMVMVDGLLVVADDVLLTADEPALAADAARGLRLLERRSRR